MEAYQTWVGVIADVVTCTSFLGSLSMSWRVWRHRNSSDVEFFPIAATTVCLQAWILYGIANCDSHVKGVNAFGFVLMIINAVMHRTFSTCTWPGFLLAVILGTANIVSHQLPTKFLGPIAVACAWIGNASPLSRVIKKNPLPETAAMTLTTCALWTVYGALIGSWSLMASNGIGSLVSLVELAVVLWMRFVPAAVDHNTPT